MIDEHEETMRNENWTNVVVFVSRENLVEFLDDIFKTFNDDPYFHYQIRGKDVRNMMGISLRFFRQIQKKDMIEKRVRNFLHEKKIPDEDYEIDPKRREESRFKDWSAFIDPSIPVHEPFSISWITTMHEISMFCISLLRKLENSPQYSATKIDMIHEFVWMIGAIEIVALSQGEKVLVIHPGFKDRVTGVEMRVGGKSLTLPCSRSVG